jgi:hypothetical protein
VNGGTIYVYAQPFSNQGLAQGINGGTLLLNGTWSNLGTLVGSGGTLNLSGNFSTAGLGTINRTNGTVYLTGLLNNTNSTLTLNAASGSWVLYGGTIAGGTVTTGGGASLVVNSGTLDGVTVNGNWEVGVSVNGAALTVLDGLTINGTLALGNPTNSWYGRLDFSGTQTLGGAGTVVFGDEGYCNALRPSGGAALTIGSGVTIRGQYGVLGYDPYCYGGSSNVGLTNQGSISCDVSGGTIYISAQPFSNQGNLNVAAGDTLIPNSSLVFNDPQFLSSQVGGTLQVSSNLLGNTHATNSYAPLGTTLFNGSGSASSPQLLEAMSQDLGAVAAGFVHNFAYGALVLANNTYVRLVDQSHNSAGAGAEALYADSLAVPAGCTFDLNGLHLYVRTLQIAGSILGGTISQLPNSGPLAIGIPTSGTISIAGELDEWTFQGQAGHTVLVLVDPGSANILNPRLTYAYVRLLDPSTNLLGQASNTVASQTVGLTNIALPSDGTYRVWISAPANHSASTGNYQVTVYDDSVPVITMQPQSQMVLAGTNVTFSVAAIGGLPLSYQWQFNGTNLPGASNTSLTLTNVQPANSGPYHCVVTNFAGTLVSSDASLAVYPFAAWPRSAREWFQLGYTTNGPYTIDPDGTGGQPPLIVNCLMSLSGGGWTELTAGVAGSLLNTNASTYREYLFVKNGTAFWYRSPLSTALWSWTNGTDLYGTYYYSSGGAEQNFLVTPSSEHAQYGVGGSSGPNGTYKCVVLNSTCLDPTNAQVQLCQDLPGVFGGGCQCSVGVFMREAPPTNFWPLAVTAVPPAGGTVCCSGTYLSGALADIGAQAASGYRFGYWTGPGIGNTNSPSTSLTMTQAVSATATFVKIWNLTVAVSPPGSGTVNGSGTFDDGTAAPISAVPTANSGFVSWIGTGIANPNSASTTILMTTNLSATALFAVPDLAVTSIAAPAQAIIGQSALVVFTITNAGAHAAIGPWYNQFLLATNANGGGAQGLNTTVFNGTIPPGGSTTVTQSLSLSAYSLGTWFVGVTVDNFNNVVESNETNNTAFAAISTQVLAPDLAPTQISGPSSAVIDQPVSVVFTITNQGNGAAIGPWYNQLLLANNLGGAGAQSLGVFNFTNSLAAGAGIIVTQTVILPSSITGTQYFGIYVDVYNNVVETNENNNYLFATNAIVINAPDLVLEQLTAPASAQFGHPFNVQFAVTNAGGASALGSWGDQLYFGPSPNSLAGATLLATFAGS